MYLFMHHQAALYEHQFRAIEVCRARGTYEYQAITGIGPDGYPITSCMWMVEADQMLNLIERLGALGVPINLPK